MYNYTIHSALKAWIDHIARAGVTFKYDENGLEGTSIPGIRDMAVEKGIGSIILNQSNVYEGWSSTADRPNVFCDQ